MNYYRERDVGPNTMMPVIMRELDFWHKAGKPLDLAEAYVLLNDAQSVYMHVVLEFTEKPSAQYQRIVDAVLMLLEKYELSWIFNQEKHSAYVRKFLAEIGFECMSKGLYYIEEETEIELGRYNALLISAVLYRVAYDESALGLIIEEN